MENQNPSPVSENTNPTPDTPVETPPVSDIPKPKVKISLGAIIGIIIFLLLAGCAAAGYVYREPLMKLVSKPTPTPTVSVSPTPTTDPTENWKIYSDAKWYGFSIKYPETINSEPLIITQDEVVGLGISKVHSPNSVNTAIYILIVQDAKDISPQAHIDHLLSQKSQLKSGSQEATSLSEDPEIMANIKRERIQVGGKVGERVIGLPSANGRNEVYIPCGDYILSATLVPYHQPTTPDEKEWESLFDQILSTLKFTDTNSHSLKMYNGKGFTFDYPTAPPTGYTPVTKSSNEVDFKTESGFGFTTLKSQDVPFTEPTSSDTLDVKKMIINLGEKQVHKYVTRVTNTESNIHEIVLFNIGNIYYQLETAVDAGGMSVEKLTSTFKFTQ